MHLMFENTNCIVYSSFMMYMIGEHIRDARKKNHLTQAQLAGILGMSRTTIGQIENGIIREVGIRKLIRILDYLGLELRVRTAGSPPTLDELREDDQ
jgi:transcriptional regulator with XRE-family HTH domain